MRVVGLDFDMRDPGRSTVTLTKTGPVSVRLGDFVEMVVDPPSAVGTEALRAIDLLEEDLP
jgi:hypothetical protein